VTIYGITGSAGFLGSNLTDALLRDGHHVVGIDNLAYGRRENFSHHLDNPRFTFHEADVTDAPAMRELLAPCEVIVHLAAHKIPRYGSALATLTVNVDGTRAVLDAARARQVAGHSVRVALASTSDVYGKSPDLPFSETGNLTLGPSNVPRWAYAVSKLFDEHLAHAYTDEYGLQIACMRFFGSYGPRHHLSWWGGPQSVFITAIIDGDEISVHGDGLQTRTFTFVDDTVRGIRACSEWRGGGCEIFNIGAPSGEIAIVDFARLVHRLVRDEYTDLALPEAANLVFVPYESFSKRPYEDVRRRVPNPTKAAEILGYRAEVDIEEGLRRTIRWHRPALEAFRRSQCRATGS
jgi:UDP-glucose 4-epimerase